MSISKELQNKLDYYEQVYCALDEPVPFKDGLKVYPVAVKDYYNFYNCFGCISMDKTMKVDYNEDGTPKLDAFGKVQKVTNIKGLGQSYLAFLIDSMQEPHMGQQITAQLMQLLELVFHIKRGMYCPKCGKEISYQEYFSGINEFVTQTVSEAKEVYKKAVIEQNIQKLGLDIDTVNMEAFEEALTQNGVSFDIPNDLMVQIQRKARYDYFEKASHCTSPDCDGEFRDIFSIKNDNNNATLMVKDIEINSSEFEELKALIPRQNILDYDGDKDIDPELKAELDLKAQMQNKDYTSPTLEKQLVCVGVATGYTIDYLKEIPMRKLSMMLRLIDRKETYYAQLQASMSGMVEFKEPPKHWIFTEDKKNIKDELTSLDSFEKKFDMVT